LFSQFLIATNTTAYRHKIDAIFLRGRNCLAYQHIDNRLLKGGAEISQQLVILSKCEGPHSRWLITHRSDVSQASSARSLTFVRDDANFGNQIAHGGFQPAKTEVLRVEHAARQVKTSWITAARVLFNLRSAGISQSQHLGDFIQCFAGGIIDSSAD